MFLTRFRFNPSRRDTRKLLASPQVTHAAVLDSFPEPAARPGDGPRVLWRVDQNSRADIALYISSPSRPDLTHLVEQAGWPSTPTWETRDYTTLLKSLAEGQRWAFRLTANPVRNGRRTPDGPTRRYGHVTVQQQRDWLLNRAAAAGFQIPAAEAGQADVVVHSRSARTFARQGSRVTIVTATYDGTLEIIDADAFRATLTHGLGKAKAYGCGLLTLAPAR